MRNWCARADMFKKLAINTPASGRQPMNQRTDFRNFSFNKAGLFLISGQSSNGLLLDIVEATDGKIRLKYVKNMSRTRSF